MNQNYKLEQKLFFMMVNNSEKYISPELKHLSLSLTIGLQDATEKKNSDVTYSIVKYRDLILTSLC